ncbi:MAG: pyridoxamine 5'-phosphate oxidase family protein [Muribaculaceae bacterium]|nr:pyridoxamine 5'-phosphate oxidase family protein [Muribaculaceae bacterium]
MRRIRQLLPEECAREILSAGSNGVLSLVDSDGEPYGVPLSFAYDNDGHIYFHSAAEGHKIECIKADGRCSLEAIELVRKRI